MTFVDDAPFVALLQEVPDGIVVLIRERVVIVAPIHPVAQADVLLGHAFAELEDELFLDLDLDPEALAIETVLVALLVALHRLEALVQVFIGAAPGMMDAHRVVGGNRTIQKRELLVTMVITM